MLLIVISTLLLLAASLVVAALVWVGVRLCGRRPVGFWRRTRRLHLLLLPVYLFVVTPAAFGWLGSRAVRTRGDETKFIGPYLDADGAWQPQTRDTIRESVTAGGRFVGSEFIEGADGLRLRVFIVPPTGGVPARATAILVHGLARGGLEIDQVGAMFHALGAEVCLVEMRNHGGSDTAPATLGLRESRDLVQVARHLRGRPGAASRPLVLFGVSLGSCAAALAAPDIEGLSGLVLDAPMTELLGTAHRVLEVRGIPQPFRSLTLVAIELWSGFSMDDVQPAGALARLPANLPSLIIGGSDDRRMPPDEVRAVFEVLKAAPELKELWIREGSGHGKVWSDDPTGYRDRLAALLDRVWR